MCFKRCYSPIQLFIASMFGMLFGMIVLSRHSKYSVMWVKPSLRLVCAIPHTPQPRHLQGHKGSLVWAIRLPNSCKTLSWLMWHGRTFCFVLWPLQRSVSTAGKHPHFHETHTMWWESCNAQLWVDLVSSREVQIPWCYHGLCLWWAHTSILGIHPSCLGDSFSGCKTSELST